MATFPPRAGILRRALCALLPQVDRLYLVLNGYPAVPDDIAADPRIVATVPPRDLRDAGKFWFPPRPEDVVFLVDDDLAYPADYVARSLAEAGRIGWVGNVFGYLGFTWPDPGSGRDGWRIHMLRRALGRARGVDLLGTGAALARGDMIAPLAAVEPFHGAADVGYACWLRQRGGLAWMLPRPAGWIANALPPELAASSIHMTDSRNPRPPVVAAIRQLILERPANRGVPVHKFIRNATLAGGAATGA